MIRKDVYGLAEKLAAESGLDVEAIYAWLMAVGKDKGRNPRFLDIRAESGIVWLADDPDGYRLENFSPSKPEQRRNSDEEALYWEGRILARQEPFMD